MLTGRSALNHSMQASTRSGLGCLPPHAGLRLPYSRSFLFRSAGMTGEDSNVNFAMKDEKEVRQVHGEVDEMFNKFVAEITELEEREAELVKKRKRGKLLSSVPMCPEFMFLWPACLSSRLRETQAQIRHDGASSPNGDGHGSCRCGRW